jgi:hypothetical protein
VVVVVVVSTPIRIKTSDADLLSSVSEISQPQSPDLQQGRRLSRVFPQVHWCKVCGDFCAVKEVYSIVFLSFAEWT